MAKIFAYFGFDMGYVDLNYPIRNGATETLQNNVFINGFEDIFFETVASDMQFILAGRGFGYNSAGTKMVKGTVEAVEQDYWSAGSSTFVPAFQIINMNVPMRDYYDAAHTPGTHDDVRLLKSVLSGNDKFLLSTANDNARGYDGNDRMQGFGGNDVLKGDGGRDTIDGGAGNDRLTGGKGADIFVFADGGMGDKVRDFHATGSSHDRVDLSGLTAVTGWRDLKAHHLSQDGANVVIDSHHGDVLTLAGVQLGDLDKGDFIF